MKLDLVTLSKTQKCNSTCNNVFTWIKIDKIALTHVDEQMITDGDKLHDKYIQFG